MSDQILLVSISVVLTASVFIAGFLSLRQHQLLNTARDAANAGIKDLREASLRRRVSAYEFLDILDQLIKRMWPDRATKATLGALFISAIFLGMLGIMYISRANFEGAASLAVIIILGIDAIIISLSVIDLREVNSYFVDQLDKIFKEAVPAAVLRLADISPQERILKKRDHGQPNKKQLLPFLFRKSDRFKANNQILFVKSFYEDLESYESTVQEESNWDNKIYDLVDKQISSNLLNTQELHIGKLRLKAKIQSSRSGSGSLLHYVREDTVILPDWVKSLSDARMEAKELLSFSDTSAKTLLADISRQFLNPLKQELGGFIDSYRSPYIEEGYINGALDSILRGFVLEAKRHLRNTPEDISILLALAKAKTCLKDYPEALQTAWKLIELDPLSPLGTMTMFTVAFKSSRFTKEDFPHKLSPELQEIVEQDLDERVDILTLLKEILQNMPLRDTDDLAPDFKIDRELFKLCEHYMNFNGYLSDPEWGSPEDWEKWVGELDEIISRLAKLNPLLSPVRTAWEFAQSERISEDAKKHIREILENFDDPNDPKIDRPFW